MSEAMKKRFAKIQFFRTDFLDPYQRIPVVYNDGGVVKFGYIGVPFCTRYGIDVAATYKGDRRWWFKRTDVIGEFEMDLMEKVFANDVDELTPFDIMSIEWVP